jgi:hypothetical protein
MKSWRTTLIGLAVILAAVVETLKVGFVMGWTAVNWERMGAEIGAGWGLIHASDSQKLEQVKADMVTAVRTGDTTRLEQPTEKPETGKDK